jgi:hypothetical protein
MIFNDVKFILKVPPGIFCLRHNNDWCLRHNPDKFCFHLLSAGLYGLNGLAESVLDMAVFSV